MPRDPRFEQVLRAWWCDERPEWTGADWWDAPMRDEVRLLLLLPAGPALAAELAELPAGGTCPHPHQGEAPPGWPAPGRAPGSPCACMVVLAAAWEACAAWVAAGCATALVQAAGPTEVEFAPPAPSPRISDPAREELAVALRTSPASMGNRMAAARELCAHPALRGLVECAAISSWGARLVVLELAGLPDDLARTVVAEVVDRVRDRLASGRRPWTSAEIGRTARRVRLRRAPDHERAARERAWADRTVQVFPERNGMAVLHAVIDGTDAHRIHRRLSAIAQGLEDPERSRDQARADALVDLILGGVAGASAAGGAVGMRADAPADAAGPRTQIDTPPQRPTGATGVRPEINVVVSIATLLGLADDPADAPGLGPISSDVARALAAEGTWRAWVTDASTGSVVSTGSRGYVPTESVARLVRAREPHCRMPGCRRAAQRCDLDHAVPWPVGATSPSNLGPLCRRHHVLKTHAGWDLQCAVANPDPSDPSDPPDPPDPSDPSDLPACAEAQDGFPSATNLGWSWRTPAGFLVRDSADPPLE